jgi:hypothetical protein
MASRKTLTDDPEDLSIEKKSLFSIEKESNDELYMASVLKEVGEDLDQMIDCIEDYKRLLSLVREKEE